MATLQSHKINCTDFIMFPPAEMRDPFPET